MNRAREGLQGEPVAELDVELEAMERIVRALAPLGFQARRRIIAYVVSWCDDDDRCREFEKQLARKEKP